MFWPHSGRISKIQKEFVSGLNSLLVSHFGQNECNVIKGTVAFIDRSFD